MKVQMESPMSNGSLKIGSNIQTNADNAVVVKNVFNLVRSAIIKRL
ncbi:hypothetical protein V7089_17985 [Neobacillus drentensis]